MYEHVHSDNVAQIMSFSPADNVGYYNMKQILPSDQNLDCIPDTTTSQYNDSANPRVSRTDLIGFGYQGMHPEPQMMVR